MAGGHASESTSAYCQARQRLPWSVVQSLLPLTAQALQEEVGAVGLWQGYRVNLFDGSTLQLRASRELTEHYGVATNQYGRSHWPLLRLVARFDLYSGAVHGVSEGPYSTGEHALAVELIRRLGAGYLHVADRNFGVYHLLQAMVGVESEALVRLKITQAKRLAGQALRPGMDSAELDLRHVKTTLQMESLAGKSVEMVRKELVLGLVACNLLRGLMAAAAVRAGRFPHELSVAQCWRRTIDESRSLPAHASPEEIAVKLDRLLQRLGRCVLPKRKQERFEPRAVWGRPRVYPTSKGSRDQARREWMESLKSESL